MIPADAAFLDSTPAVWRIFLISAIAAAAMYAIARGDVLAKAQLVGRCTAVTAPAGDQATWQSCWPGRLEGRPDLTKKSCTAAGVVGDAEIWRCPDRVVSGRST